MTGSEKTQDHIIAFLSDPATHGGETPQRIETHGVRACQTATHSASVSRRPKDPGGLVRVASLARAASLAAKSGPGNAAISDLISLRSALGSVWGSACCCGSSVIEISLAGISPSLRVFALGIKPSHHDRQDGKWKA